MASYDVTVRGAGIFGLCVAWSCLERGARVQVIDPAGVASGASGGLVGALVPHTPENWNEKKEFQFLSLLMARAFWPEIERISGLASGYARAGRLQPLADNRAQALALRREAGAAEHWRGQAAWNITDSADEWAPVRPTGSYIHDTLSAHINPHLAMQALAEVIERKGGAVCEGGRDEGAVVWATGVTGLAELSDALGQPIGGAVKGQAALLALDHGGKPQIFADALHVMPHLDGTVAVGSTSERTFDSATETDALLDDVVARARAAVPALGDAPVIKRWAGLRPRARSRAPILGAFPGRTGHFIANGGFKIGFGMAPLVGEVIAKLALEGKDAIPAGFHVDDNLR